MYWGYWLYWCKNAKTQNKKIYSCSGQYNFCTIFCRQCHNTYLYLFCPYILSYIRKSSQCIWSSGPLPLVSPLLWYLIKYWVLILIPLSHEQCVGLYIAICVWPPYMVCEEWCNLTHISAWPATSCVKAWRYGINGGQLGDSGQTGVCGTKSTGKKEPFAHDSPCWLKTLLKY